MRPIRPSELRQIECACEVACLAWAEGQAGMRVPDQRVEDFRSGLRAGMSAVVRKLQDGAYLDVQEKPAGGGA